VPLNNQALGAKGRPSHQLQQKRSHTGADENEVTEVVTVTKVKVEIGEIVTRMMAKTREPTQEIALEVRTSLSVWSAVSRSVGTKCARRVKIPCVIRKSATPYIMRIVGGNHVSTDIARYVPFGNVVCVERDSVRKDTCRVIGARSPYQLNVTPTKLKTTSGQDNAAHLRQRGLPRHCQPV